MLSTKRSELAKSNIVHIKGYRLWELDKKIFSTTLTLKQMTQTEADRV